MKATAPAFMSHTPQRRLVWAPLTWDSVAIVVMSSPSSVAVTHPDARARGPIAIRPECNNFALSDVCASRGTPACGDGDEGDGGRPDISGQLSGAGPGAPAVPVRAGPAADP